VPDGQRRNGCLVGVDETAGRVLDPHGVIRHQEPAGVHGVGDSRKYLNGELRHGGDPEALGNDALEADLYILREKLREQTGP